MNWEDFILYVSTFSLVLGWCFLLTLKNNAFKPLERYIGKRYIFLFPLSFLLMLAASLLYLKKFFGVTLNLGD